MPCRIKQGDITYIRDLATRGHNLKEIYAMTGKRIGKSSIARYTIDLRRKRKPAKPTVQKAPERIIPPLTADAIKNIKTIIAPDNDRGITLVRADDDQLTRIKMNIRVMRSEIDILKDNMDQIVKLSYERGKRIGELEHRLNDRQA